VEAPVQAAPRPPAGAAAIRWRHQRAELGFRLPELLILNLSLIAGDVLFPAYSAVDRDSLGRAFLIATRYTVTLCLPLAVGLIILARPIILGLFGDQWTDSITVMQILSVYAFAITVGVPAGTVYKSTGRVGVLLGIALLRLIAVAGLLLALTGNGINTVASIQAIVASAAEIACLILAMRILSVGVVGLGRAILPSVAASAIMAVPLLATEHLIEAPWPAMIVGVVAGLAAYAGSLLLLAPDTVRYLKDKLLPREVPQPVDPTLPTETERLV
jgi:PST family polysaccharide transporter